MAKRGNGEGTIYKRKDGRWETAVTLEGGNRKRIYGKTRSEVSQKLTEALRARKEGRLRAEPSQTVGKYLNHWLEDQVRLKVRPRTYESYSLNVRRLVPYLGQVRLDALKPREIQHCYKELLATGLSPRSVEQAHRVLRSALRQAVRSELLTQAPTVGVTAPRPDRHEMSTLTAQQVHTLFASSVKDPLHALWVLLCTTGLRLGEATGLEWRHIDLSAGTLTVQQALQRQQGQGLVIVEPKTAHSRRTVHLAPGTVAALQAHRDRQKLQWRAAEREWDESVLVFCTRNAKPLEPGNVLRSLHRALKRADLPIIRVHDLRHTAATYLLGQGTHPKKVQELLGHSSITLTLDTYSHMVPSMHQEVAAEMDRLFEEPGEEGDESGNARATDTGVRPAESGDSAHA